MRHLFQTVYKYGFVRKESIMFYLYMYWSEL